MECFQSVSYYFTTPIYPVPSRHFGLKNYFFNKESLGEYQDKWVSIFEKNEDVKDYWNRELDAGRRTMIDLFFDAFFQIIVQDQTLNIKSEDSLLFCGEKDSRIHINN